MPSFLYPAFLIGAAAVAIPLLLHLLRNQQAPEVRFSAVRLLRGVRVEHAQRRHVRDWLLLALRMAALLLLALAFARPYLSGDESTAARARVVLLDRSASMAAPAVWARARAAALEAIDAAPAGEPVGLIAFDDRPELLAAPTMDRGAVRHAVDRLRPGVGGTQYAGAMARAVAVLEDTDAGSGRIVLIGDLQGTEGDARVTVPEAVVVEVVKVAAGFDNVALIGAVQRDGAIVATVRNDGVAGRRVRVRVESAGGRVEETQADVPASQTIEAVVPVGLRGGDVKVVLVAAGGNELPADDARVLSVDVTRPVRVLVVGGAEDAFYVRAALGAGEVRPDFEVAMVAAPGVAGALGGAQVPDAAFVLGPRGLDRGARDAIARFARNGGGVLVASSDPGFSTLLERLEVLAPRGTDAVLALASFDRRHPLFQARTGIGEGLGGARFTRAWRVRAPEWQLLARFDDGAGALFERREGRGRIVFLASDMNRRWNDLPVQAAFVPFVQEMARYLAPAAERREYTPGTLPAGTAPALGFIQLASGRRVAVNPDVRESGPSRMEAKAFERALKRRPDRHGDESAARRRAQASESGQALWRYGLMLMFATLVAEGVIGSRVRRT